MTYGLMILQFGLGSFTVQLILPRITYGDLTSGG